MNMSAAEKYVICIDLGTSGPKVSLATLRGQVLAYEFEPTKLIFLPNGGAEQDALEWWHAVKAAMKRLLNRKPRAASEVIVISTTSQWVTTVAVDRAGRPLMNAISWMDTRGAKHVRKLTGGPITIQGYSPGSLLAWLGRTGGIPTHSGKDSIAHILFLKNERPEIYCGAYKFLEPKDFLNLQMTGEFGTAPDVSLLLWLTDHRDINNIHYDEKLLKLSGIERSKLPDLKW